MCTTQQFVEPLRPQAHDRRQAPPIPQNPNGATPSASAFRDGSGQYAPPPPSGAGARATGAGTEDQQAIERYRYLLRTAPPETIEQVHAAAFAKLTESQRQQVPHDMSATLPAPQLPPPTTPRAKGA